MCRIMVVKVANTAFCLHGCSIHLLLGDVYKNNPFPDTLFGK